ncbi:MAG: hypothetical protein WDM90_00250 [Ferruginibacter sp.]
MKKYVLLINLFITTAAFAQVPEDALRYSFFHKTALPETWLLVAPWAV